MIRPYRSIVSAASIVLAASACAQLRTEVVASGLTQPIYTAVDPSGNGTRYIVEKGGTIRSLSGGSSQTFFQFGAGQISTNGERGLLSVAFAPNYGTTGHAYLYYTDPNGALTISRFTKSSSGNFLDESTKLDILKIDHPGTNHNGGTIKFGSDGYLYLATGDGGGPNDVDQNAQNPNSLLGKMLRIRPNEAASSTNSEPRYFTNGNPFEGNDGLSARDEIWSFGYRNPFRFSFDDVARGGTGALVVADVGENAFEEINYEPFGAGGRNYGWSPFEGNQATGVGTLAYADTKPTFVYDRSLGSSITGGFIYRGSLLGEEFKGRYFFGDFVSQRFFSLGLVPSGNGEMSSGTLLEHTLDLGSIVAIEQDFDGEILVTDISGRVVRVVPEPGTFAAVGVGLIALLRRRRKTA